MKIPQQILCAGLAVSTCLGYTAFASDQITPKSLSKASAKPLLTSHAAKQSHARKQLDISPPRQVSPKQFEQLLQSKQTLNDHYRAKPSTQVRSMQTPIKAKLNTGCSSVNELQSLTGDALVNAVINGDLNSCLYGLFDANLVGTSVFSDQSLQTIADAMSDLLSYGYDGTDVTKAAQLEKLVIYLRAMFWAESGTNRVFDGQFTSSLANVFNQYFSGQNFFNYNGLATRDFMVRYEMLILLRSSGTNNLPYLVRLTESLLGYASTVNRADDWGVYYEENGVTQILTHLFNASSEDASALEQLVKDQPELLTNLSSFVLNEGQWLVGHTREYQWGDSVNELARFLKFGGIIADTIRPTIITILNNYDYQGDGSTGWLKAQTAVMAYDSENCDLYGDACSFDLEAAVLSGSHTCSTTLKLRYQEPINESNRDQICLQLAEQETAFHQMFQTAKDTPVANDHNTDLEVVIFSSYTDYDNYAGNFFGIDTDNGGMYLEGNPATPGNQARFIAHQATWLPTFQVWNLQHEYVHYLDGRFNLWGSFSDQPDNSVWWSEGLAEYLSQPNNNSNALAAAANKTYALSELFQTTYANGNTERIYHWGYLATRFMMEKNRTEIDNTLLPTLRAAKYVVSEAECSFDWSWKTKTEAIENNWYWAYDDSEWASGSWVWTCGQPNVEQPELPSYTPYQDIITAWGVNFDAQFNEWLDCIIAGNGECVAIVHNPADIDGNQYVDSRDIAAFNLMLRQQNNLSLDYDFNQDGIVDRRDIRSMMALCDQARCAITQ
ncbi:collagenase [Thalassotalea sp. PP2-459]|uniref:collagenase n=1 Tax=Thalassotalea sp. PP2-459 TaxID=1742724 RepID=UPI000942CE5E|nr:collagenase [Thalassotalea sp. PP2-459]OKY27838.1 hypothetical protein BI291_07220 [Thalassotalea sp. PP2-459]